MSAFVKQNYSIAGVFLIALAALFLASGCALTSPGSERLVFRQNHKRAEKPLFPRSTFTIPKQEDQSSIFTPSFLLYYLKMTFRPPVGELQYAKSRFASYIAEEFDENHNLTQDHLTIRNPYYFSLSLPISLVEKPGIY